MFRRKTDQPTIDVSRLSSLISAGVEIAGDLCRDVPMHRLLQGDVGSGKTVVAALAAAICIDSGYQASNFVSLSKVAET